jgi:hypothetical protein
MRLSCSGPIASGRCCSRRRSSVSAAARSRRAVLPLGFQAASDQTVFPFHGPVSAFRPFRLITLCRQHRRRGSRLGGDRAPALLVIPLVHYLGRGGLKIRAQETLCVPSSFPARASSARQGCRSLGVACVSLTNVRRRRPTILEPARAPLRAPCAIPESRFPVDMGFRIHQISQSAAHRNSGPAQSGSF